MEGGCFGANIRFNGFVRKKELSGLVN